MANIDLEPSQPPLLRLPREIRDEIYETLLFATPGTPREPIPPTQISDLNFWIKWRLPLRRGSCFGIFYSCRKIHGELIEEMERYRDVPLELELTIIWAHRHVTEGHPQIWPTWIKPPLLIDPNAFKVESGDITKPRPRCRDLTVVLNIQTEKHFAVWGDGERGRFATRHLFGMLADFLLYGPIMLSHCSSKFDQKRISEWDIDTLSLAVVGAETEFIDPYDGQPRRVPKEVVKNFIQELSRYIGSLDNGAVAGRIGKIRLREGRLSREWLIDESKVFPEKTKKEWARYGWVTDPELLKQMKVVRMISIFSK